MKTRFFTLFALLCLSIVATVGCSSGRSDPSVASAQDATAATTLASGTASPEQMPTDAALTVGGSFTVGDYDVKLLQVVEWPEVTVVTSKSIATIPPKQADNKWLVIAVEINSHNAPISMKWGQLASTLALIKGYAERSSAIFDADGKKNELSAIGALIPAQKGWYLTHLSMKVNEVNRMAVVSIDPLGGSIFLAPGRYGDGISELYGDSIVVVPNIPNPDSLKDEPIDLGNGSILADPARSEDPGRSTWFVGLKKVGENAGKVAQFSLLFEIPKRATDLAWQFLNSPLIKLPQPTVGTIPDKTGGGVRLTSKSMTVEEMCRAWAGLLPPDTVCINRR
jgi:hypothetical protein